MILSDTQKAFVTQWVQDGRSLADVQRSLREDFDISLTYMDVRFLVDDLEVSMPEPKADSESKSEIEDTSESEQDADSSDSVAIDPEIVSDDSVSANGVSVDVDAIMRPGSLVSGTVRFSDGVSLGWQLSASGQLGLIPGDDPEYRPDPEDVQSFQTQLEEVLRKKGL